MTEIPSTMKAMVLKRHGGLDALEFEENWPTPNPKSGEVLIKVTATGMNNTDINTRSGWYSKEVTEATTGDAYETVGDEDPTWGGSGIQFPRIQGADVCGHVVAVGEDVDASIIGKRVITDNWLRDWDDPNNMNKTKYFGSECDGGYAQYCTLDHRQVYPITSELKDEELATFSCSYSTAEGMLERAKVEKGDRVLVTGASGGVGGALIQLAKRRGAFVIAMTSDSKRDQVAELNPDVILPRAPKNLASALKEATGEEEVDVVADIVGGEYFATLIEQIKRGGYYTCSGAIAGPIVNLDLRTFYLRDLTFTGSTVIPPKVFENLASYIEDGDLKPVVAATFPLEKLREAQQMFVDKKHTGNIVVVP